MQHRYSQFLFEEYLFDEASLTARFTYSFDGQLRFSETVQFAGPAIDFNRDALDRALRLAFLLAGTSYYKAFPGTKITCSLPLDVWQAAFLNKVYQEGLSQFAFENDLTRQDLGHFVANDMPVPAGVPVSERGVLAMQSGGKDSLLLGSLLNEHAVDFESVYISAAEVYPAVIDGLGRPVRVIKRTLDKDGLRQAAEQGGLNGHVPVTYIVGSYTLIQALLAGANTVLMAIGHEGDEPHAVVGDLDIMHQWSKTWSAEADLAAFVNRYVSPDLRIGSPLRKYSELRIADLFAQYAWGRFGHSFSSCNVANYKQGHANQKLTWCADCPKCANNFLLFAPFVEPDELKGIFNGENLLQKPSLQETFKGLLGIDGVMKPFECVGEIDELRSAYHMAVERWPQAEYQVPYDVAASNFDYRKEYPMQRWAEEFSGAS